jgi:hypothetical protein
MYESHGTMSIFSSSPNPNPANVASTCSFVVPSIAPDTTMLNAFNAMFNAMKNSCLVINTIPFQFLGCHFKPPMISIFLMFKKNDRVKLSI